MTTKTLNRDALQILKLLRCGPHVLEVLTEANDQLARIRGECIGALTTEGQCMLVDSDPTASGEVSRAIHRLGDEKRKAESELFALGVQVAALKERLKLAEATVGDLTEMVRNCICKHGGWPQEEDIKMVRAAFDAVPGDVGSVTNPATPAVDPLVLAQAELIDRLVIQRDAAEALARDEKAGADEAIKLRNEALARAHAAEALARERLDGAFDARLLWQQSEAACAQMNADRDAAQQMVAEMRLHIVAMKRKAEDGWEQTDYACIECYADASPHFNGWKCVRHRTGAILEAVAPIAGRWCLASERDEADAHWRKAYDGLKKDRDGCASAASSYACERDEALGNVRRCFLDGMLPFRNCAKRRRI
jgi:hypothetical protein